MHVNDLDGRVVFEREFKRGRVCGGRVSVCMCVCVLVCLCVYGGMNDYDRKGCDMEA